MMFRIHFILLFGACQAIISPVEMQEKGKLQYQLLQERVSLPKYGSCWKQAVEHIDEGCKSLTEETQSDVALHLTNCFLEMSGHEMYNCELNRKPNLRGICINSMSDRAFNVYTEFYTHTQNICWFLQGQVWQEMISESTVKMGEVLRESTRNQMVLLENQKQSLELQERLSGYGGALEEILISTMKHQELLRDLQSWIIGEVSWIDSVVFYLTYVVFVIILTSSHRLKNSRLPITFLILFSVVFERLLSKYLTNHSESVEIDRNFYYRCIWYFRYFLILSTTILIIFQLVTYKDYVVENNILLKEMHKHLIQLSTNITHVDYIEKSSDRGLDQNHSGFNKFRDLNQFIKNNSDVNKFIQNGDNNLSNNSNLNQFIQNNGDFNISDNLIEHNSGKINSNYIESIKNHTNCNISLNSDVNNFINTPSKSVKNISLNSDVTNTLNNYSDFKDNILNERNSSSCRRNNVKSSTVYKNNVSISRVHSTTNRKKLLPLLNVSDNGRYNLRSQRTPDTSVNLNI